MRLNKKVILVTASTRGIGLAAVAACAKEGAIVYMAARNRERAETRIKELKNETGNLHIHYVHYDAEQLETCRSMADEVTKAEGRIDVLVNNFGSSDPAMDLDIAKTSVETFLNTVTINLGNTYAASQAVIPCMRQNGGGSIINISSISGLIPDISQVAYGTAKSAINHLTELIAVQEARNGIRCNAILPGMTQTDAVRDALSGFFCDSFLKQSPIQRMAKPEEIAAAVVYFAADESSFTTGQLLTISGGFGLATPLFGALADLADRR